MDDLPIELILIIFKYLNTKDKENLSLVSKKFHTIYTQKIRHFNYIHIKNPNNLCGLSDINHTINHFLVNKKMYKKQKIQGLILDNCINIKDITLENILNDDEFRDVTLLSLIGVENLNWKHLDLITKNLKHLELINILDSGLSDRDWWNVNNKNYFVELFINIPSLDCFESIPYQLSKNDFTFNYLNIELNNYKLMEEIDFHREQYQLKPIYYTNLYKKYIIHKNNLQPRTWRLLDK